MNGVNPPNTSNIIHINFSINDLHLRNEFKTNYDNLVTNKNYPLILNETWVRLSLVKEIMNMKKLKVALAILVAAVMAGNAQTTVNSDIVGYSKISAPSGTVALVPGFVKSPKFAGSVTFSGQSFAITGLSLGELDQSNFSDRPNYPTHYVEITAGAYEGYSYDIAANTASSVIAANVPSAIDGQTVSVVIRPHVTLDDIASASMAEYSDAVNLINPDGSTTTRYYAAGSWIAEDFSTAAGHTVIYPGQAVLLSSGGVEIITTGVVKTTKTAVPLYAAAVNYVGPLSPGGDTKVIQLQIAPSLAVYSDGFNQFTTDGTMTTIGTYYSDGVDVLDAGFSPLPSTATDSITTNTGFALSAGADGYWIMPSPLSR